MNYLTHQILNTEELEILRKELNKQELAWEDGKQTAGKHAAKVKNNLQLDRESDFSRKYSGKITRSIPGRPLFIPISISAIFFALSITSALVCSRGIL